MVKETRAALELERSRKGNKVYFDQNKNIQSQPLKVDDLVLVHNIKTMTTWMIEYKLDNKWYESNRIREVGKTDYYRLMELDGVELKENYVDNRLKRFFSHEELDIDRLKCHDTIRVRDILDLSKWEDEIESDEEELDMQEMIEVVL